MTTDERINLTELMNGPDWEPADLKERVSRVLAYLAGHTPVEKRARRHPGCTTVQERKLDITVRPPDEVVVWGDCGFRILGWTVDGGVIVEWWHDSLEAPDSHGIELIKREPNWLGGPHSEYLDPRTWRERAAFVQVGEDVVADIELCSRHW